MSKRITIRQLAKQYDADEDEILIALWDAGFDSISGPSYRISPHILKRVKLCLGWATREELKTHEYWANLLGIDGDEFLNLLETLGAPSSPAATKLPRKAMSLLKVEARRMGIDYLAPQTALREGSQEQSFDERADNSVFLGVDEKREVEKFEWCVPPGHRREMMYLTVDDVVDIHNVLVRDFASSDNPLDPPGVRSDDLLASAVFRAQTSAGGVLKYPTVESTAAALLHALIMNHPFYNGNKRTALVVMLVFLDENDLFCISDEDRCYKLVIQTAQHTLMRGSVNDNLTDREVLKITDWIHHGTRVCERGNHAIPWRKLRRILIDYDCECEVISGNRMKITRKKKEKHYLRTRVVELKHFAPYHSEGSEAGKGVIKKIREDLQLDDAHGVDAHAFYKKDPEKAGHFVARYRKTLHRLGKI